MASILRRCGADDFRLKRCGASNWRVRKCTANPCAYCGGTTPTSWLVTISGNVLCECVSLAGGGSVRIGLINGDNNGTWEVPQDAVDPCLWMVPIGVVRRYYYNDDHCSDLLSSSDYTLYLMLGFGPASERFFLRTVANIGPGVFGLFGIELLPPGGWPNKWPCGTAFYGEPNQNVCGSAPSWCGYGGVVTAIPQTP